MIENLIFIVNEISPVFILVILGMFLRKAGMINEQFVKLTSYFIFNVSLPVFVFLKLYNVELVDTFDLAFVIFILFGTLLIFGISWIIASKVAPDPAEKGVFIQGSFRSNYAIIGFAIILNILGEQALAKASLLIAFILPVYNLLAVFALTMSHYSGKRILGKAFKEIAVNPLVLGVIAAVPFSLLKIDIPDMLKATGEYLSDIALPLALISIGGSLNLAAVKKASYPSIYSSLLKIVLFPALMTILGYFLGFTGYKLGIIFIIFGCPTAIASFVMAAAMKGNIELAGNIIVISTLGSIVTMTLGLLILTELQLI
jgi:predicted permease